MVIRPTRLHNYCCGPDGGTAADADTTQIGTYNAAVLAARHGIPFIVVAPVSTIDMDIADGSE